MVENFDTFPEHCTGIRLFLIDFPVFPLVQSFLPHDTYVICPGGENAKTPGMASLILDAFFSSSLSRKDRIGIIGGGALCDVGSFAASLYMRGISFSLFPTTLLAMVDAAIGGKTAINSSTHKNMLGTFYPASSIHIYPHFLSTLSAHHLRCGLAEILKAGTLLDASIIKKISTHAPVLRNHYDARDDLLWRELIWRAVTVKLRFVNADFLEKESSGRARVFLNFGHTFAHAIEAEARRSAVPFQHGDAVALGIRNALLLGTLLGKTKKSYYASITEILDSLGYPDRYPSFMSARALMSHMRKDKKTDSNRLRFVLQTDLRKTFLHEAPESAVYKSLHALGAV